MATYEYPIEAKVIYLLKLCALLSKTLFKGGLNITISLFYMHVRHIGEKKEESRSYQCNINFFRRIQVVLESSQ